MLVGEAGLVTTMTLTDGLMRTSVFRSLKNDLIFSSFLVGDLRRRFEIAYRSAGWSYSDAGVWILLAETIK